MLEDDGYAKLGRYEVQLRRGLYQAVRELRMLRAQWTKDSRQSSTRRPAGVSDEQASEQTVAPVQSAATASADRPKAEKAKKDTT